MIKFPGQWAFFRDTSFFFASLCPRDVNYERAGEILKEALARGISLILKFLDCSKTNSAYWLGKLKNLKKKSPLGIDFF
jgi:hypothetical protein